MEFLKDKKSQVAKILFTGLDAAGKTSIILAFQRELSKIAIIKPTKGVQRRVFEFMGREFSEWDLGGQAAYRISYLKKPSDYFDKTQIAIYVIDIQDSNRFDESISYLKDVVEQFKKLQIDPPIYIFFHKYDPAITKSDENKFAANSLNLKELIRKTINYQKLFFYHTSIFNITTIFDALADILLALFPRSEFVEKSIEEFSKKFNADAAELIDDNSLVIASYYKNEAVRDILKASTPYFLDLNESLEFSQETVSQSEDEMMIKRFGKYFIFKKIRIKNSPPYYLLMAKDNQDFSSEDFDAFVKILTDILFK